MKVSVLIAAVLAFSAVPVLAQEPAALNQQGNQQLDAQQTKKADTGIVVMESTIRGAQEQPRVLYVVPWQAPENPPSLQQWIDAEASLTLLKPLERPVLLRQMAIYQMTSYVIPQPSEADASAAE